MNFCGIISEFNPFHNGHKYIIEKAKELTNCKIISLMSGNFVQRGEASIIDKYKRAESAIKNGANSVIELPTIYACSNAENFAFGAIKILKALNVKYLAFGIEKTNIETLQKVAQLKYENSGEFKNNFKNEIENGINFNTALKRSIAKTLNDENILEILNKPNNILAVEYLTQIIKQNANIIPIAIERVDNGFYSDNENGEFLSATSIRDLIFNNENIDKFLPKNAKLQYIFDKNSIKTLNSMQILKIKQTNENELEKFYDYNEGIEYRIKKAVNNALSFNEIKDFVSSSRYRISRVNKLLLYPLLNISKSIMNLSKKTKPYAKILTIKKEDKELLKQNNRNIDLIASNKDYEKLNKNQKRIVEIDLNASSIYNTIINNKILDDKKQGTKFL